MSLYDTSDEEFDLSSGLDNDYEEMLLLRIRKLESEMADLQRRVGQNKSDVLAETAENMLWVTIFTIQYIVACILLQTQTDPGVKL